MKKHGEVGNKYFLKETGLKFYRIKGHLDDEESVCYVNRLPDDLSATYTVTNWTNMEGLMLLPNNIIPYYFKPKELRKSKGNKS